MSRFLKSTVFATTALSLGVGAAPAFAQESNSGDSVADIVVTARRTEERLQDVPISITVFNQEQLSDRNVVNAADLANYTPSLSANTRFGGDSTSFAIRGFSQELRTTSSVGVYFADVVAPRGGGSVTAGDGAGPGSFFDLQNVQVLKGPQGTLFGRNTTGGAVLLVPQRPTDEFGGYLEASGGDYEMWRLQGVLNIPLGDQARLRLGMDRQERDGYLNNVSGVGPSEFGDVNYEAYRASFVVDLTPNLENYIVASYSHSLNNGPGPQLFACATPGPGPFDHIFGAACQAQLDGQAAAGHTDFYDVASTLPAPHSSINQWQLINTTSWDVSDTLTVRNIVSYGELVSEINTDVFGIDWDFALPLPGYTPQPFQFVLSIQNPGLPTTAQSTFTEEFQLQGRSSDDRLTWQAGLYYEESDPTAWSGSRGVNRINCRMDTVDLAPADLRCNGTLPFGLSSVSDSWNTIRYINQAIYSQATYSLTDQLKLTGGLRYTWDRTVGDYRLVAYQFPFVNNTYSAPSTTICADPDQIYPNCDHHVVERSEAPTWLLDVDYTPTEDVLLYAKYARGYRQGSVNVAGVNRIATVTGLDTHGPEQVDSYEIGSKWSFHGSHPGILNAALFYNDFSDQQIQLGVIPANGAPTTAIVNAGASTIWGLELEGNIELFDGFDLSASYAYLNTNIDQLTLPSLPRCQGFTVIADCTPGPTSLEGEPLSFAPENKAQLTASYRLPLSGDIGEVTLAATYVFVDKQQAVSITTSPYGILPAYELVNFNLNWANIGGRPIDASLFVTNAFEEHYWTFVPGLFSSDFESRQLGEPRMLGARLRYRFGAEAN